MLYLSYISFTIVPLWNYILLPVTVIFLERFVDTILLKPFNSSVAFLMIHVASQKCRPCNADFRQWNK